MGYIKKYIFFLRLRYEKPTAFALCVSFLDIVAFVRLSLFKTKGLTSVTHLNTTDILTWFYSKTLLLFNIRDP
ncbi:hypothetical protein Hanom_Chr02g00120881 [Helianthus anomalus]